MNLLDHTIELMNKYGVAAQKRFSQNFLVNQKSVDIIIKSLDFSKVDHVIEIGPGLGSLTNPLLSNSKKLTSIEFDNDMIKVLSNEIKDDRFTLIQNDFLKEDLTKYNNEKVAYIGNLPYQITRDLIKKVVTNGHFEYFGFMLQKDLADELFYKPGLSCNSNYSAFLAMVGRLERILDLKPNNFYPSPKVDSTFVALYPTNLEYANMHTFKVLDCIFKNPKKTLFNNLKNSFYKEDGIMFESLNIDKNIRPHQLDVETLRKIIDFYKN